MIDWENIKIFLALAQKASVRAAGSNLGISHATVARRINIFEEKHGVRLFDRLSNSLVLTAAGEEMLQLVLRVKEKMSDVERCILGQDNRLEGEVRITISNIIAINIMPDLVAFTQRYPDIDLKVISSYDLSDLSQRKADVAIYCIQYDQLPPEHLVGHRLARYSTAIYASKKYLQEFDLNSNSGNARWISWGDYDQFSTFKIIRFPKWTKKTDYAHLPVYNSLDDVLLLLEAVKQGMGITILPCFVGDKESSLVRLPTRKLESDYDIWFLTHPDLKNIARLRIFRQFIKKAVEKYLVNHAVNQKTTINVPSLICEQNQESDCFSHKASLDNFR